MRIASIIIATAAIADGFPAIGAYSTRRIMLLHGTGSSASSFLNSPTRRGAKDFIAGIPAEGIWNSNERWNKPGMRKSTWNWHISALDAAGDGDWHSSDGSFGGLDGSVAQVEAAIEEREVTCLIGLEQGGLVAAIVAARAALGESSCSRLRAAIICGAAMPDSPQHVDLLHRLRDAPDASLPTLHCLSESDAVSPLGQELAACFGASAELLWHPLGNAMPSRYWWKDSDAFLERAWQERWSGGRRAASELSDLED